MKDNKKGFTLVEILAAVTILGIISVVALVSINNVIQRAKEKHYVTAEDQLKMAGQSYVQQNRSALPKVIGQKTKIPLKLLVQRNYIKTIKDYSDNNCDIDESYVQVFKYSQKDYSYVAYLKCPTYTSKKTLEAGSPKITIEISDSTKTKKANAKVTITDQEKLLSWSYIIYREGEEVKNSGSTQLPNYDKSITKTINLEKYTPGKVKIVVTATNIYGLTEKTSRTVDFEDTQPPTCIIDDVDKKGNPKNWTKGPVTITVGCNDGDGVGCKREKFSTTFKKTTNVGVVTIEDKQGNKTKCEVSVNVDVTPPSVPKIGMYKWVNNTSAPSSETGLTEYKVSSWSDKNIYTKGLNSDDGDGIGLDKYQYTITGKEPNKTDLDGQAVSIQTEGTSTIKYRACDKLGNCSAYSAAQTIKVDKKAPTCTTSVTSGTKGTNGWYTSKVTLTGTCKENGTDDVSGCKANATINFDKEQKKASASPGTVYDNAGNSAVCGKQEIGIDWTAPSTPSNGNIGTISGSNAAATIQTKASGSTDSISDVSTYLYVVKTNSTVPAKTDAGFKDSLSYTRACGQTNYAYAIAVDNAGNRSAVKSLGSTSDKADKVSWTECTAKCDGGKKTGTNSCLLKPEILTDTCNTQGCCSSVRTEWGGWSACDASCGTGRQTRSGTNYSNYDGRYCSATSDSRSCDTGKSCCSESNPTGCNWVTSCREGTTYIYTSSAASTYAGTVQHHLGGFNDKLYVLGTSGNLTKVYASSGKFYSAAPSNHIVYIYTNCISPSVNEVCPFDQCPSLG